MMKIIKIYKRMNNYINKKLYKHILNIIVLTMKFIAHPYKYQK